MARFDVRQVEGAYFVDVQTDILDGIGTRLVVPLLASEDVPRPIKRLHPLLAMNGLSVVMATHLLVAVPERALGRPTGNLRHHYDEIIAALDMIFLGF